MNIFIQISNSPRTRARFSENQSAPRLENRKTSPCSPCAPNLLHVLVSRIPGYHNLCSPDIWLKHFTLESRLALANVWSNLFLFNLFKDVFDLFHKISCLGSFIDRHFSVHLDVEVMVELLPKHDSFFYQLPMSMYLHLS